MVFCTLGYYYTCLRLSTLQTIVRELHLFSKSHRRTDVELSFKQCTVNHLHLDTKQTGTQWELIGWFVGWTWSGEFALFSVFILWTALWKQYWYMNKTRVCFRYFYSDLFWEPKSEGAIWMGLDCIVWMNMEERLCMYVKFSFIWELFYCCKGYWKVAAYHLCAFKNYYLNQSALPVRDIKSMFNCWKTGRKQLCQKTYSCCALNLSIHWKNYLKRQLI